MTIGPDRGVTVTFQPDSGAQVTVGDFEDGRISSTTGASHATFLGPVSARSFRADMTTGVTVDGWTVNCGGCDGEQIFHAEEVTSFTASHVDVSNNRNNSLVWINGTGVTFDDSSFHDAGLDANSGAHTECVYAWDVTNLTIRRSNFTHCSVMDVFITGGAVVKGGDIENNVFDRPWESTGVVSQTALSFHFRNGGDPSPDPDGWRFYANTFVGPLSISDENTPTGDGVYLERNLFESDAPCGVPLTTFVDNAFTGGGGCGSTVPADQAGAGYTSGGTTTTTTATTTAATTTTATTTAATTTTAAQQTPEQVIAALPSDQKTLVRNADRVDIRRWRDTEHRSWTWIQKQWTWREYVAAGGS